MWKEYMKQACPVWCTHDFDCLEGEHRLLKQTCHFDYGDKFLCQAACCIGCTVSGTWGINKTPQLQTGILESKLTQWNTFLFKSAVGFLVEALWLVTGAQIYLEALKYPFLRCFPVIEQGHTVYLRATDILFWNISAEWREMWGLIIRQIN